MSTIKFKIAAKTDVGRIRTNNEDNFQAASDLTTAPMKWVNGDECDLGDKGALLVVADGMGGMNAGEVASEIAINTIREFFSPDKITADVLDSKVGIETFMKRSIVEADKRIKEAAKKNPEHRGMGTTIVIAWLLGDSLYVAWCGDSRAYIYNRMHGLRQISKDHSYVQTLVDKGKITHEEAFDYPDSNIITRCLSDSDQKARPDTIATPITVCNNDIILLFTDGLSGMIRDHEIEQILTEKGENITECTDCLIEAACEAAGQDNITVALCQIISGAVEEHKSIRKSKLSNTIRMSKKESSSDKKGSTIITIASLLILFLVFVGGFFYGRSKKTGTPEDKQDSLMIVLNKRDYQDTLALLQDYRNQKDSLKRAMASFNDTITNLRQKLTAEKAINSNLNVLRFPTVKKSSNAPAESPKDSIMSHKEEEKKKE